MATDAYIRKYIIYKYPKLVEFIETNPTANYNTIYHNPHFNLVEYARHNEVHPWYFSEISTDDAIDLMLEKPELIDFEYLMVNTNPRIRLLMEGRTYFSQEEWKYMSSSCNSYIMEFLEQNLDNIDWERLSFNKYEGAIRILKNNPDRINWKILMRNTSAIEIFKVHTDKIIWNSFEFCANPDAIELIEKMVKKKWEKINFNALSTNPNAIHILSKHMDKVKWKNLSQNPNAISILMENPDMISFSDFLTNPNAIPYIETIMEKRQIELLDWNELWKLAQNLNSIPLIQKWWDKGKISTENMTKLISYLYYNRKSVYECYDFQEMSKERSKLIYLELISKAFHPSRIDKWLEYYIENGGCCEDFDWV
jgi:hypothetical protein